MFPHSGDTLAAAYQLNTGLILLYSSVFNLKIKYI